DRLEGAGAHPVVGDVDAVRAAVVQQLPHHGTPRVDVQVAAGDGDLDAPFGPSADEPDHPVLGGAQGGRARDAGRTTVAAPVQVVGCLGAGVDVVGGDAVDRHAPQPSVDQHHRDPGLQQGTDLGALLVDDDRDHPGDLSPQQLGDDLGLHGDVLVGVRQQHRVAVATGDLLD